MASPSVNESTDDLGSAAAATCSQSMTQPTVTKKADIEKLLSKNDAIIVANSSGKSDIWQLFGKISHCGAIVKDFVACKACKKVYSCKASDGTQTLRKHRCEIGQSGPAAKVARVEQKASNFNWKAAGFEKKQQIKPTVPESVVTDLNNKAVIMCATDFRPLSFAKHEGFQMLAQTLVDIGANHGAVDVKSLFKDPTTFSRSVLPRLANEARQTIASKLKAQFSSIPTSLSPACFVTDHWTDKYRQIDFTSIGVIFIDENFEMQMYDLCVREYDGQTKHACNIHDDLMRKLEVYVDRSVLQRVEGKFVFVSDSDAKLVAALREDFDRQSCVVHDLSICVKAALKGAEMNTIGILINDSKVLVRHFKKTGLNRKLPLTLKQDVSTRFNSVYIMLKSVDDVFDEVTSQLTATDDIKYLSNIKRKTLKSLCKELQRFYVATQKLAVEKRETLHLVVPVLQELKTKLLKQASKYASDGDFEMAKLCNDFVKSIEEKCFSKLTWYHFAAVVLYPEFRSHSCVEIMAAEIDRIRLDLRVMVMKLNENRNQSDQGKIKSKAVLFDSDSESEDSRDSHDTDSQNLNTNEFELYNTSTFDCDNISPLEFWKTHAKRFPSLSLIARSVFAIPASQNQTERSFSAAGHVMTDLRSTLDPEHLDELLLVRSHYRQTHQQ